MHPLHLDKVLKGGAVSVIDKILKGNQKTRPGIDLQTEERGFVNKMRIYYKLGNL